MAEPVILVQFGHFDQKFSIFGILSQNGSFWIILADIDPGQNLVILNNFVGMGEGFYPFFDQNGHF